MEKGLYRDPKLRFLMKEFRISDLRFRIGFLNLKTFNNMTKEELKNRTKKFALMIIKLVNELPNTKVGNTIGNQLIRSGTSVAANYRASCRARSTADFVSKITIVEEECDESLL